MGKSTAAARFRDHGIEVFDADAEVHRLYAGPLAPDIERAFPGSLTDGKVDRAKLSARCGRRASRLQTSRIDRASENSGGRTRLPSSRARARRSDGRARSAAAVRGRRLSYRRRPDRRQRAERHPTPTRASTARNDKPPNSKQSWHGKFQSQKSARARISLWTPAARSKTATAKSIRSSLNCKRSRALLTIVFGAAD